MDNEMFGLKVDIHFHPKNHHEVHIPNFYLPAYHAEPDITSSQVGAALVAARAPG